MDPKAAYVSAQWAHERPLISCRFDPSGQFVFCGSEDAVIERFRLSDGAKTLLTGGHSTWVNCFAFGDAGKYVISGGCDGKLTWWETAAEAPVAIRSVPAHGTQWVRAVVSTPSGSQIVSGGNDNMIRIWNAADGTLVRELSGHQKHVYSLAFDPTGKFLFSGDLAGVIKQWDMDSGAEVRKFDGSTLYSYNGGQQVDFGGVRGLAVSADGKRLVAGGLHKASNPLGAVHEPLVLVFNIETQALEKSLIAEGITQGVIWNLRWLSDGSIMGVTGGGNGGLLLFWKPDTDKDYHRFTLPNIARDMDLHPDGIQVATAHHDKHVRITRLEPKPA